MSRRGAFTATRRRERAFARLFLLLAVCGAVLGGCTSAAPPTPERDQAPTAGFAPTTIAPTSTATPAPTFTPVPTPTQTLAPTPFVTAPPAGQSAVVPILMYHNLADLPRNATELQLTWTVAPGAFDKQLELLSSRGFHTITMAQLVAHLSTRQPLPSRPLIISFDDGWASAYTAAFPALKRYGFIGTFFVYPKAIDAKEFLSWTQLEEMSAAGMDIQSHTLSHAHLRNLTADAALQELAGSKNALEKRLGKSVVSLSWPFGEYNDAVIDLARRAGYQAAVTLAAGYKQRSDELFKLHRIRVTYRDAVHDLSDRLP